MSFVLVFELLIILSLIYQRILACSVPCEAGLTTELPLARERMMWVVEQDEKQHLNDTCAEQQKTENPFFFCLFHESFFLKKR